MKKLYLPLLLCISLILSSCGRNQAQERFVDFMAELAESQTLSFTAQVRCEYEEKTVDFVLSYSGDREGCQVSVTEPELIRGIKAHASAGKTALEFDGVKLDTGPLDAFGLSPMSALPVMVEALRSGYLDSAWEEQGQYAALLIPSDNMNVQVNLDKYTMSPVYAELISDGRVAVFMQISDWTMQKDDTNEGSGKEDLG